MRKRQANEKTISNIIDFLAHIKLFAYPNNEQKLVSLVNTAVEFKTNKSAPIAMEELGIITRETPYVWHWNKGEPDRLMALELMENLLTRHRIEVQAILPVLGDMVGQLKKISEVSLHNIALEKSSSKGLKMALKESGENLFTAQERNQSERAYIIGQIAGNIWGTTMLGSETGNRSIEYTNVLILQIAEDLLLKMNQK